MTFDPTKPYNLPPLPLDVDFETVPILKALNTATKEIGELKGYCTNVPNPYVLMSAAITKESVASSSIENIHTTLESTLEGQVIPQSELRKPEKEVLRYREALYWGIENQKKYSISTRLILGIHKTLLETSIGYRKQQNAIKDGIDGEIVYTPPISSQIPSLISNWENFVNETRSPFHPLVRAAISHYQFEAIHPFGDGNGRTGRILLALQLVTEKLLDVPVLYISGYLKRKRNEYYHHLSQVTENDQWEDYVLFMIKGFEIQAVKTKQKLFEMMRLYESIKSKVQEKHTKMNAIAVVNHIFSVPVTTPTRFSKDLKIHYQTASKHLAELKEAEVLADYEKGRHHYYYNPTLLNML